MSYSYIQLQGQQNCKVELPAAVSAFAVVQLSTIMFCRKPLHQTWEV